MPENLIIAYKNPGETPLECLEKARYLQGIADDIPMTYAGRLDPMAEGVMIILVGEECKNKDQYLGLNKTYEFEILVGFKTDTNDLLGVVIAPEEIFPQVLGSPSQNQIREKARPDRSENLSSGFIQKILPLFMGTFSQKYPSFSSKTVGGKQLFQLALDGELPIDMPEHEVTIFDLKYLSRVSVEKAELEKEIMRRILQVKGDFRQERIIENWKQVLNESSQNEFEILKLVSECSSGTYIRQLVADIGEMMGVPLVTYSITRTKVGEYEVSAPL